MPGAESQYYRNFTPRYLWKLLAERKMRPWARLYQPQFRRDYCRICFSEIAGNTALEKGLVSI